MIKYIVFCSMTIRVLPLFTFGSLQQQFYYSSSRARLRTIDLTNKKQEYQLRIESLKKINNILPLEVIQRNPYDVLGLKNTCSVKDIKEAYIKLCKELHPDMKPGEASQHKKFVELNNAYTNLLNTKSKRKNARKRAASDSSNYHSVWRAASQRGNESHEYWSSEKAWYEKEEYQKYYQHHDSDNLMSKNFKKANLWVIAGCFVLIVIGSVLYISAYSYATKYAKETVDEKSKRISESYLGVRQNLVNKGKTEQLDDLKKRWSG